MQILKIWKIYIEYKNLAYGIAFSFVKNAEDIVQNVFYKLFNIKKENLPDQNEIGSNTTYKTTYITGTGVLIID